MSLYDKAAVAFFAKGAAGKDRVAYNAKPVEKLGEEYITNGGFDTDSGWTFTAGGGLPSLTARLFLMDRDLEIKIFIETLLFLAVEL